MYNKYIPHNPSNIFWNIQEILTIGQILAQPSTIEQKCMSYSPCKMLDFGQTIRNLLKLSGILPWRKSEVFQNICPIYFLKNRNYDLFKLKFWPWSFVQIIQCEIIITPANKKDT